MFTPLITHNSDGAALAAPVNAARCNGAVYKPRTIDDLRIKDDRLRAAIEGTGHLLFAVIISVMKGAVKWCQALYLRCGLW